MKIKGFIYYGFGALLGAFLAAVIVACFTLVMFITLHFMGGAA